MISDNFLSAAGPKINCREVGLGEKEQAWWSAATLKQQRQSICEERHAGHGRCPTRFRLLLYSLRLLLVLPCLVSALSFFLAALGAVTTHEKTAVTSPPSPHRANTPSSWSFSWRAHISTQEFRSLMSIYIGCACVYIAGDVSPEICLEFLLITVVDKWGSFTTLL